MSADVSHAEIDAALNNEKAPGIDGFNVVFFKKAWPIIKHDVYKVVLHFFHTSKMAKQWNCTTITLVPKVQNPSYVIDFRPIACCTMVYMLISKVITSRLSRVVGFVINESQASFIPGKHIGDNIILSKELIKGYSHKFITPRCMLKVDLKKTYDSVEWSFLETVLGELGFPNRVITWIIGCVSTVSYSILINGFPTLPFPAKKGLR